MGSLKSWVFSMLDFYSDVVYYQTVPKSNALLQNVMLISLVLPPTLNFLWLSWKIGKKDGWQAGIIEGLAYTVVGLLGFHDLLIFTDDKKVIEYYDIIRANNAGFEDCIQFIAQSLNTFAIGGSFNAVMLVSPLLSIHGITTKFRTSSVCRLKNEYEYDGSILVEQPKTSRILKSLQIILMTYGALIGTVISCIATFLWHDQQYAWFASRVWLSRPPLFTEEVIGQMWIGLYVVVVSLIVLALCYFGYTKCSGEKKET